MKTEYAAIQAFITKDGSEIREPMHPLAHPVRNQSLAETADAPSLARGPRLDPIAEAMVAPGGTTALHRHHRSEELYYITAGQGRMTLRILCTCAPPYAYDDTELL